MSLIKRGSPSYFAVTAKETRVHNLITPDATMIGILESAAPESLSPTVVFGESMEKRGLAIKQVTLLKSFDYFIPGLWEKETNLFFLAWAWDLSGAQVVQYPLDGAKPDQCIIPLKAKDTREFMGDGAVIFPARKVIGGLGVRIQLWKSCQGERDFGETLSSVSSTIKNSPINHILGALALGTGVTGATVDLVAQASLELAGIVGDILKASKDQYVDLYEGYYSASEPWQSVDEVYHQSASVLKVQHLL